MAVTVPEARELVIGFCRTYPVAAQLAYYIRNTVEELYGDRGKGMDMLGGYITGPGFHPGRCDIPSGKAKDSDDFMATLRHEVIGHFGLNTFTGAEKKALLDGISASRQEPSMRGMWARIDANYADRPKSIKAEEVFALFCEGIEPGQHINSDQVHERGGQAFRETCIDRTRPMRIDDLENITRMVAQGLHDRTRTQQNFPELNQQFRKKENEMEPKKPFHETVAENLIEQMKQGTAPWQKPWQAGNPGEFMPINTVTGKRYKGINAIHLMSQGYTDQRWMTYKQALAVDAQVRRGEKGTPVQYWKFSEEHTKLDANGKPVLDAKGEPVKQTVMLERPRVFFAVVFNAEQIDGLPALQPRRQQDWNSVERAEKILQLSGAVIKHGEQNQAFYRPSTDSIHLPDKGQFPTADNYYATALHELGHWTGHESRLDRDLVHPFGSGGYAKEELRAEIASMILGDELGIGHDPGQHVAYVASWIKALEEDPLEIFRAASDAEKIHNYVLSLEQKQVQDMKQFNEHDKAAELARANEERVRRDPNSTAEEISAAKEARKDAEFIAMQNDEDLQRRIAQFDREQQQAAGPAQVLAEAVQPKTEAPILGVKTFIDVTFKEKDQVKALGAKWDREEESWYVPAGVDVAPFAKWAKGSATATVVVQQEPAQAIPARSSEVPKLAKEREYLAVPFGEHVAAKAAGALWDIDAKSWFVGPKADMAKLARWALDNVPVRQGAGMSPEKEKELEDEFAEALRSLDCVVDGKRPIMDGEKHRIAVVGDKRGEQAGFYVAHLDGYPAGYIKNNRSGIEMRWKSKGYTLDPEQKAQMQAAAAAKLQAREVERDRMHEQTAQRIGRQMADLVPVIQQTAYMQAKGIQPQAGVMTDKDAQKTYIPATDANGKQWSMQYIQEDGTKRFAKDSRKEGCFHAVGGLDALARAPALVIGEGYATAGSLSQTLGFATVAAFDSGNLLQVAKTLREKFPDKPIIIAGDDDRHLEVTQGVNPGRSKAEEAAKAVGGKVLLPIFAPGEAAYPKELLPVTPQAYREHLSATKALEEAQNEPERVQFTAQQMSDLKGAQLSAEQLAALNAMKRYTDFNDLAHKSALGHAGIHRQVNSIVDAVIEKHQAQIERQKERHQTQEHVLDLKHERTRQQAVKIR